MKRTFVGGIAAVMLLSAAYATDNAWTWDVKPLKAAYSIYSGDLGEREAPTKNERKLAIAIEGQAAKEILIPSTPTPRRYAATSPENVCGAKEKLPASTCRVPAIAAH